MITQKRVKELNGALNIQITENHKFNKNNIYKYLSKLETSKEQGILHTDSFESDYWIIVDFMGNRSHLKFDIDLYPDLKIALKCYLLIFIDAKFSINHIRYVSTSIKQAIIASGGFKKRNVDAFEEYAMSKTLNNRYRFNDIISKFLSFIQLTYRDLYDLKIKYMEEKNRDLPNYEVIIDFHYFMMEFENQATALQKTKFFPIILWWKITGIIPMRPKEFCLLEWDCCYEQSGNYFLKVPRSKQEAKSYSELSVTNIIRINKNIYDSILEYKQTVPSELIEKYLFSFRIQSRYYKIAKKTTRREDMYHQDMLHNLLICFYKEIVGWNNSDFYRFVKRNENGEINRIIRNYITLADTRHFSICNMMLQGINPLTIAKMAGHTRIGTQRNYWGHLESFVESHVYIISTKARINKLEKILGEGVFDVKDKINESRIYTPEDFPLRKEVKHGYCKYGALDNCAGECRYCNDFFYYPKNSDEGLEWLLSGSEILEQQLVTELKSLLNIYKNMKFNLATESYSMFDNEQALSKANLINRFIRQKAMVDALIQKDSEVIE
ncbi:hypothetical protein CD30_19100 [Ureibacillus massiliensis 4400831 = CIP 108448 = CCUG 49529]|uniref:Integrase n=1 Tax=Ureibacillus massiliensis 4400831 = CIP 108448 = CCUG 49529 TaxID=1211035 RepID=A0A0A3ILQ6_9BACL|nr:site-specific integrase [Ureibacillus massiliensis]KGR85701.1 hypothetical protein CD30_19100 [Ureibacillus massiliensis 4400831 = CIP 108448 = CCUG 49529]